MAKQFLSAISCYPGAVGSPGLYLGSDTSTGFYRIGANNIGVAVSGSKVLDISSTGILINKASADNLLRINTTGAFKSGVALQNNGNIYGQLYFDNSNNNVVLYQQYATGSLLLGVNTSTIATISSTGMVITGNISGTNLSGTNTGDNAANSSTHYIGTTAIALNRASAAQALTGITSIDGNAATATTATNQSGGTVSATTGSFTGQVTVTGSVSMNALKGSGFGYAPGSYAAVVIGATSGNITPCFNYDPSINASGAFSGLGHEVVFRNGVTFVTPNAANTGWHNCFSITTGIVSFVARPVFNGNTPLDSANYSSYAATSGHTHAGVYEPANANIQSHISSTSNPHSTTAAQVGLGNVTNESKATMFTSPTFTSGTTSTGICLFNNLLYFSVANGNVIGSGYSTAADDADIWINYRGYADGFGYFRDFRVGNGKGTAIAFFDGSSGNCSITGAIDASNLSGTNTGDNAANSSTHYIGTTAIALNRASAAQALTGITSIDGYAAAVTLTADNSTNATNYPLFVNAATGNLSPRTDTGYTYNPSTGDLTIGGTLYATSGSHVVLHAGNYNSYSPTLTGTGASGSWGISITGTAGAVTNLSIHVSSNPINPNSVTVNHIGYANTVSLFGQSDGGLYNSSYSTDWNHQIFGDFRTGQIAVRGKNSGAWQAWRTVRDTSNFVAGTDFLAPNGNGSQLTNLPASSPSSDIFAFAAAYG